MESPRHSYVEPRSGSAQHLLPPDGDEHGLTTLRSAVASSRNRFLVVNAVAWAAIVGVPTLAGIPLGTAVVGRLTVGMLLFAVLGCLLLGTAVRFDRSRGETYRAWNGGGDAASRSVRGGGRG
ncbi:hypothetical protein [Streptomyces sp. NBC_01012]|uniref:hypothetical protein n=1 Tax=Streptomyces sp. NBC_01012 TaxID=2903717 RepID=UPI00386F1C8B|nr:hypothetical protein OG623_01985 [Streptomyces sp. NBC_01012]